MILTRGAGPELAPFIERIWYYESRHAHAREVVLPSGRMQLLVSLDASVSLPLVVGVSTRPTIIDTTPMRRMVGVLFRAGGAQPFVSAPCLELRDGLVGLDELGAREAGELADRVCEERSPPAMLDALEHALLRHALGVTAERRMIAMALEWLHRGIPVAEIVRRTGASRSRFVRLFASHVGTTPRQYASLARFQRAVQSLAAGVDDLASIATGCGYFDQAHFSHEFRRFAGRPPTLYRPRDPREPNHLLE